METMTPTWLRRMRTEPKRIDLYVKAFAELPSGWVTLGRGEVILPGDVWYDQTANFWRMTTQSGGIVGQATYARKEKA